jgi:LuxR family transcriptional regulator, maltose regulon positive regulatory protein
LKEIIIQSRITPPKPPANIISRNDILALISENRDKKLINIVAPAGYGKTTLVCEFLQNSGIKYAWCHLGSSIISPLTFLNYITHSFKKLNKDFGSEISVVINALKEDTQRLTAETTEQILLTILNEFQTFFSEDIYLVLDDLHEISGEQWFNSLFNTMLSELPQNLHVIVTSRFKAEYNLAHFRAKREIVEIGIKELSFKHNEIKQLSDKVYSRRFTDEDISYLEETLGGWITGIHLLIQASGSSLNYQHKSGNFVPDILFDYFANEIFVNLDENIKEFLLKTSYLENFTPEICNHVTGMAESENILNFLHGKNIFIESSASVESDGKLTYRYNYIQLFRNFLIDKFKASVDDKSRQEIMFNISNYYLNQKEIENAIEFGILSGNFPHTENILSDHFDALIQEGKFELLWNWVNALSAKNESPFIMYSLGLLYKFYKGDLDKALNLIEKCLESSGDNGLAVTANISKAQLFLDKGQFSSAVKLLEKLQNKANLSPSESSKILYNLGYAYFFIGDYSNAVPYLQKSAAICEENNFNDLLSDVYFVLGNIYITSGEFVLSRHYYELALTKITRIFRKFAIMGNLTILYSRSSDYEKAFTYYQKTMELHKIIKSPIFSLLAGFTKYSLYFESADYHTALKTAEMINMQALEINNSKYLYLSYLFLGECNFYLGNTEKCEKYYQLASEYIDKDNENDKATLDMFRYVNLDNNNSSEPEVLLNAYDIFSSQSSNYDKAVCCFYIAAKYLDNSMPELSGKYLSECLTLSKEKEYRSFLTRELIHSKKIFNYALAAGTESQFIREIFSLVPSLEDQQYIDDSHRSFLSGIILNLSEIRMQAFGKLEFYVHGKIIDEKKWIRKKRKLILAYLLLNQNYSATKDKIIDVFFPDTPLDSIDNTFHQAVSNLRSALKDESSKKKSKKEKQTEPEYIIYEGKALQLNPDFMYTSDVHEFDELYKKAFSSDVNDENRINYLKKAVDLYNGNLLEESYEPWAENLRDEYRNKFIKCCEKLIGLLDKSKDNMDILNLSAKLLEYDKLNETAYVNMLNIYINEGKQSQAAVLYNKICGIYRDELGEEPPGSLKEIAGKLTA